MKPPVDSLSVLLQLLAPGVPAEKQLLIASELDNQGWSALLFEAERQGVTPLLYTVLSPLKTAHNLRIPILDGLYQDFLSTAGQNLITLHSTNLLISALRSADIPTAGLKGIYLLESVYENIGARTMTDIDILVRKKDLAACLSVMNDLGYHPSTYFSLDDQNIDTKHIPPMEKGHETSVEVHWTLLEENEPFTLNADALWDRMRSAVIANVEALTLGLEDLILHLSLHLTYQHYLNLGLRGLMDIGMIIHKDRALIDWQKLATIAKSWGSERVTALTLKLVETQLNVPIPGQIYSTLLPEGVDPFILEAARTQLLQRVMFEDRFTPDLVELSASKSLFTRIKIGLQRVFIPRLSLARVYNVSPKSPKILGYYLVRLKYLIRHYGKTLVRLQVGSEQTENARQNAEKSTLLHNWMIPKKG